MSYILDKKYDALKRSDRWDEETQRSIKERIANEIGENISYEFLTQQEGEILEFIVDALIPQKKDQAYIKLSEIIDKQLLNDVKKVRYGQNPWPREFYRKGLADFAKRAKEIFGKPVEDFSASQLENYIEEIFKNNPSDFLRKFLRQVLSDATSVFFSHPAAWNEIGFPGPAYPEGYPFLECEKAFDWEPKYEKE